VKHKLLGKKYANGYRRNFTREPLLAHEVPCVVGNKFHLADAQEAFGIDWMGVKEISQSFPIAYTEFIGKQIIAYLEV